jgi:hypothetical protein
MFSAIDAILSSSTTSYDLYDEEVSASAPTASNLSVKLRYSRRNRRAIQQTSKTPAGALVVRRSPRLGRNPQVLLVEDTELHPIKETTGNACRPQREGQQRLSSLEVRDP